MSLDQSHLSCVTSLIFIIWFHTGHLKNVLSCIIARIRGYVYKVLGINSATLLHLYGYDVKSKIKYFFKIHNVDFVIIYCHLKKVSSQIYMCIIFEPNELSITLSTAWTDEDEKKIGVSMEKSKVGTKERSPDSLSQPNQNTIIIIFF